MEQQHQIVGIANIDMAAAWDGPEGDHWTEHADHYEGIGTVALQRLLDAASIESTEHVLDIGCGTGAATRAAARLAPTGAALGIDLSSRMLAEAERRAAAEGLTNATFVHGDAQVHPFASASADVAISSFGTMFFTDAAAAFSNIGLALRPGGRLALTAWRDLASNEWLTSIRAALAVGRDLPVPPPGMPGPFAFADAETVRAMLAAAGYADIQLEPADIDVSFGDSPEAAYAFFASMGLTRGLTESLDDDHRRKALAALRAVVDDHASAAGVVFGTALWVITARNAQ